jgi:hypothetical protein
MEEAPDLGGGMICRIIASGLDINGDFSECAVTNPVRFYDGRE